MIISSDAGSHKLKAADLLSRFPVATQGKTYSTQCPHHHPTQSSHGGSFLWTHGCYCCTDTPHGHSNVVQNWGAASHPTRLGGSDGCGGAEAAGWGARSHSGWGVGFSERKHLSSRKAEHVAARAETRENALRGS